MTKEIINRTKLIAEEGMVLTNGETFGKQVFLAPSDSPDNWWEITEEEYSKIVVEEDANNEEDLY